MNVITKERLKELIAHIPEDIFIKVIYNNETYSGIILSMEDNNPCTVAIIDVDNAKIRMCTNHNPLNENKELIIDDFTMNSSFSAPSFDKTIVGLLERWEAAWKEINSEWKAPKEIETLCNLAGSVDKLIRLDVENKTIYNYLRCTSLPKMLYEEYSKINITIQELENDLDQKRKKEINLLGL